MTRRLGLHGPDPGAPWRTGGVAVHVATVRRAAEHLGWEVTPLYVDWRGAPGLPLPRRARTALGVVGASAHALRARLDVVHANTSLRPARRFPRDLAVIEAARARGTPVLLQVHGGRWSQIEAEAGPWRAAWRRLLDGADRIGVFPGPQRAELEAAGFGAKLVTLLAMVAATEDRVPDPDAPTRFLFLGALTGNKDPLAVLEALASLRSRHPEARLEVVGDGPLAEAVRARAGREDLAPAVTVHGDLRGETLRRVVRACNAFVLPSHQEGLPLSFLEAAEAGLAPLVTAASAVPSLFEADAAFVPLRPGDAEGLRAAMEALAGDPAARERLGAEARAAVHRTCTVEAAAPGYGAAYDELRAR